MILQASSKQTLVSCLHHQNVDAPEIMWTFLPAPSLMPTRPSTDLWWCTIIPLINHHISHSNWMYTCVVWACMRLFVRDYSTLFLFSLAFKAENYRWPKNMSKFVSFTHLALYAYWRSLLFFFYFFFDLVTCIFFHSTAKLWCSYFCWLYGFQLNRIVYTVYQYTIFCRLYFYSLSWHNEIQLIVSVSNE